MKGFVKKRAPKEKYSVSNLQDGLMAINLCAHTALNHAFANDVNFENSFANQVLNYGRSGDVLLGITTSGNSKNVIAALKVAKDKNMKTIALTGANGGAARDIATVSIIVPESETYKIQELHLPIYHALCLELEEKFFKE
jgi:D-sedoheptulose 7-phosphate isomerase